METVRVVRSRVWQVATLASLTALLLVVAYGFSAARAASLPAVEVCVNKFTGVPRMAANGGPLTCQPHEVKRNWAVQGEQGPAGLPGEPGPPGPPGSGGLAGYEHLSTLFIASGNTVSFGTSVTCPAGKRILGGGAELADFGWTINSSFPLSETTWRVEALGPLIPSGEPVMKISITCADIVE